MSEDSKEREQSAREVAREIVRKKALRLKVVSSDTRISILGELEKAPGHRMSFTDVKKAVGTTDGQIFYHLLFLGVHGLINTEKKRRRTMYTMTADGLKTFESIKRV